MYLEGLRVKYMDRVIIMLRVRIKLGSGIKVSYLEHRRSVGVNIGWAKKIYFH